jgi:hypothetical protein
VGDHTLDGGPLVPALAVLELEDWRWRFISGSPAPAWWLGPVGVEEPGGGRIIRYVGTADPDI